MGDVNITSNGHALGEIAVTFWRNDGHAEAKLARRQGYPRRRRPLIYPAGGERRGG
jgi:hypothetical protein